MLQELLEIPSAINRSQKFDESLFGEAIPCGVTTMLCTKREHTMWFLSIAAGIPISNRRGQ